MDKIEAAIHRMGLEDCVTVWGYVPHSDIHRLFAQCSVFALPSVREGVSVSLLEAMASGCLCVVSDIRDNREIIQHGRNGILFKTDDEEDLANSLRRVLLQSAQSSSSISVEARLDVERLYSLEAVRSSLSGVIASVEP